MKTGSTEGFTLMEVLIAITLTSVIFAIISGAVTLGRNAWEKGEDAIQKNLINRWFETTVRRQIGSIDARIPDIFFRCSEQEMIFLSGTSITGGDGAGVYRVRYFYEKDADKDTYSLYVDEVPIAELAVFKIENVSAGDSRKKKLISSAGEISFTYIMVLPSGEVRSETKWVSSGFPDAVKIHIKYPGNKADDYLIRIPKINLL